MACASFFLQKPQKTSKKPKKVLKKVLTNGRRSGIICKSPRERGQADPKTLKSGREKDEKNEKFLKKLFKNLLTNGIGCDIIEKSARETAADKRSLKIEQ